MKISKKIGDYLIISLVGGVSEYIAEVTQEAPLRVKVTEDGPYSNLSEDDLMIDEKKSLEIQGDDARVQNLLGQKPPLQSGLSSLGVKDGKIHEILPA